MILHNFLEVIYLFYRYQKIKKNTILSYLFILVEKNMSDSDEDKKRKRIKRMCVYREEWQQKYSFIKKNETLCYKSYCDLCRKSFSISHGGLNDVKKHCAGSDHQCCERNLKKIRRYNNF